MRAGTETKGERTRRRIVDEAAALLNVRGYHAARVDDIVKLARTSHGTFYLYFANKEELFKAVVREALVAVGAAKSNGEARRLVQGGGVRISGVRSGSPAEQAGLKGGDIITSIGDRKVANLVDMTEALRAHQPGDTVVITVKREGADVRTTAVLGRRGS